MKVFKISIFLILFGSILYGIDYYNNIAFFKETLKTNFKGELIKKVIDKQDHNIPKLTISCFEKTVVFDLATDESGLFEYVSVGDSIEKIPNSMNVRVYNARNDTILKLKF